MLKKNVEEPLLLPEMTQRIATKPQPVWSKPMLLCTFAFILCILLSVTPLHQLPGTPFLLQLPTSRFLELWGGWLPSDFHWIKDHRASQISTNTIEVLLLIALAFVIYGLSALVLRRQTLATAHTRTLRLVWIATLVAGLIFVFTPGALSHDVFVYAAYGRTVVAHGANPYFVPISAFPHDPFTHLDDWKNATAAYGPLWLGICSLWALILGDDPLRYILAYRLLGFALHLLNTVLVARILRTMGRSQRTILLGTLLYAWNPLVLLESILGAHNDTLMITFILAGILLSLRAERRNFTQFSSSIPPILAFTFATLVKFTAAPLLLFFLVLLACRALHPSSSEPLAHHQIIALHWRSALSKVLFASLTSALITLASYTPFWIGHSIAAIVNSFSSPPSAHSSEHSILRAFNDWIAQHGLPTNNPWAYTIMSVFSQHKTWDAINLATLAVALIIGTICLWRTPTTRTLILVTLATLGALLIVTPWFFAWYVTWLVGLSVVLLPISNRRLVGQALVAFALTFSATAFFAYLFNDPASIGDWSGFRCLTTIGPPLLVFLIFFIGTRRKTLAFHA